VSLTGSVGQAGSNWLNRVRTEVESISRGPSPDVSVGVALALTGATIAWGNAVVLVTRNLSGDARNVLTTAAHPLFGVALCATMRMAGWRSADMGLTVPSRATLSRLSRPAVSLAGGLIAAAGSLFVLGGVNDEGTSARLSTLRLVLGTALGEELINRGALFALWSATGCSPQTVAVTNGLAFGAWHLAGVRSQGWVGRASEVFVPAIAGTALFLWGRCRSKSITGSWALHLATNLPGHAIAAT
jgi:hypothetical protein